MDTPAQPISGCHYPHVACLAYTRCEDAGGYFARSIGALFGRKSRPVETYQKAAERLLREQ